MPVLGKPSITVEWNWIWSENEKLSDPMWRFIGVQPQNIKTVRKSPRTQGQVHQNKCARLKINRISYWINQRSLCLSQMSIWTRRQSKQEPFCPPMGLCPMGSADPQSSAASPHSDTAWSRAAQRDREPGPTQGFMAQLPPQGHGWFQQVKRLQTLWGDCKYPVLQCNRQKKWLWSEPGFFFSPKCESKTVFVCLFFVFN